MTDPESPNQRDLVRRGSDEMRRILWPQNLGRMRIEGNNDRSSIFGMGMPRRGGDDGLMTEMHSVESANGKKERTLQFRQLGNGMKDFHQNNTEWMMTNPPNDELPAFAKATAGQANDQGTAVSAC